MLPTMISWEKMAVRKIGTESFNEDMLNRALVKFSISMKPRNP